MFDLGHPYFNSEDCFRHAFCGTSIHLKNLICMTSVELFPTKGQPVINIKTGSVSASNSLRAAGIYSLLTEESPNSH